MPKINKTIMAKQYLDAESNPYFVVLRSSDGTYQSSWSSAYSMKFQGDYAVLIGHNNAEMGLKIKFDEIDWDACLPVPDPIPKDAEGYMAYLSTLFTGQLGTLVPFALTAGDWISIEDGVVSFSGGVVTKEKTITTEVSTGKTTKYASRTFGVNAIDAQEYGITTGGLTTNSSAHYVGATEMLFTISEYSGGIIDITNEFRVSATDVSMSAYPNTRNDYPTGDPVNLLTTDANGKIQSFNKGITGDISILGTILRFANGILVEYIP